jgi:uncharacterized membrane protein HdeD (DUF308 family)
MLTKQTSLSGLLLIEGIFFSLFGICALAMPYIFTLSFELVLGVVLVLAGVMQGIRIIQLGSEYGRFLPLLYALLAIILGVMMLMHPIAGILALTIFVAAFFLVEGIAKISFALQIRPSPYWGWLALNGFLSLVMTALVIAGWPWSATWFIGILIGVNLLLQGISLTAVSFGFKKLERL